MGAVHGEKQVYEREKIYEEVWQEPVMVVAKRYGISDVMLKKICKRLNVPTPPLGYWAKLRAGKPVERPQLPPAKGRTVFIGHHRDPEDRENAAPPLAFLKEAERQRIFTASQTIEVDAKLMHPHRLLVEDQQARIAELERREESARALAAIFGNPVASNSERPLKGILDIAVSEEHLDRAYRVLDAVFQTIERLDGRVAIEAGSGKIFLTLLGQPIRIRMTGMGKRLMFSIQEYTAWRNTWRDTPSKQLEQQLSPLLIGLFECAHRLKAYRQEQERTLRRRQQAEQQRLERLRLQQEEMERFEALEHAAQSWSRARIIEAYVIALEQRVTDDLDSTERAALQDYITWAKEKIAWLDPLVKHDDPFIENHGEQPTDVLTFVSSRNPWVSG